MGILPCLTCCPAALHTKTFRFMVSSTRQCHHHACLTSRHWWLDAPRALCWEATGFLSAVKQRRDYQRPTLRHTAGSDDARAMAGAVQITTSHSSVIGPCSQQSHHAGLMWLESIRCQRRKSDGMLLTCDHFCQHDPKAIDVGFFAGEITLQHLWSAPAKRLTGMLTKSPLHTLLRHTQLLVALLPIIMLSGVRARLDKANTVSRPCPC